MQKNSMGTEQLKSKISRLDPLSKISIDPFGFIIDHLDTWQFINIQIFYVDALKSSKEDHLDIFLVIESKL